MDTQSTIDTFQHNAADQLRLNKWIFERIHPLIKGRVLEIDSGLGFFSSLFVENKIPVHLNASDALGQEFLRNKFNGVFPVRGVHTMDFSIPELEQRYSTFAGNFNTVLSLNILENGFFSKYALEKVKIILSARGRLIVALPSLSTPYPGFEQDLEELKRYARKSLAAFLNGFEIITTYYFNWGGFSHIVAARKI